MLAAIAIAIVGEVGATGVEGGGGKMIASREPQLPVLP